jgi:hypothetical protein
MQDAKVAQLVERNLAKVKVAGSRPVFRSEKAPQGLFLIEYQESRAFARSYGRQVSVVAPIIIGMVARRHSGCSRRTDRYKKRPVCLRGGIGRHAGLKIL